MSYSDINYIQVQLYDNPDPSSGLWGEVVALLDQDRYERIMETTPEIIHIPIEEVGRYHDRPFPINASRTEMSSWVRAFERAYLSEDRRRTSRVI